MTPLFVQFVPPAPAAVHASPPRSYAIPPTPMPARPPTVAPRRTPGRCAVVGDSIALGIAEQMRECYAVARVGIGSAAIAQRTPNVAGSIAIISAGANDPENPGLTQNLETIRYRTGAFRVIWVLPRNGSAGETVRKVAQRHGDLMVNLARIPSKEGVHPKSYPQLAGIIRTAMGMTVQQ